jgi:4-carboxymuconolactone decarboxylase
MSLPVPPAQDRLPPIPPDQWTAQQRQEAQAIIDGPRGALIAPFVPLLRSPELTGHAQRMGEYLRYRNALGLRLSELAILIVARYWSQQVEWSIHASIARRAGIREATIDAIGTGCVPADLDEPASALHVFATELLRTQQVSDATYARALAGFGEQGVIDLVGCLGYYALLAMVMNVARTPVPADAQADQLPG